jgi:hypothetical protein
MPVRTTSAFVAGAAVALVLGTGTAYAATGGNFRLGYANAATRTTTLTNAYGTALQLNSKAGQPSLRVNRNVKVPNLNADLVDGVDSARLARVVHVGTVIGTGTPVDYDDDGSADGVLAVATCPPGSQVMGGGGGDGTPDGLIVFSGPDQDDSWLVVSSTQDLSTGNAELVEANARCWNPIANVADATGSTARATVTPSMRKVARQIAQK